MTRYASSSWLRGGLPLLAGVLAVGFFLATPLAALAQSPPKQLPKGLFPGGAGGLANLDLGGVAVNVAGVGRGLTPEQIVDRLTSFDKNKDGRITMDELPERMQHLIARGDCNNDGALDSAEILKLATSLAGEKHSTGVKTGTSGLVDAYLSWLQTVGVQRTEQDVFVRGTAAAYLTFVQIQVRTALTNAFKGSPGSR